MTTPSHSTIETLLAETAWVRALAARLTGSAEEADDLVQETWVAALRRPPAADGPVRPWLATVLRNTLRQRYRKGSSERAREEDRAPEEGGVPAPEEWLERLESQELVSRLVRELPVDQREVVLLRFHEGLSSREISARLDVPAGTVRWRLKVALDDLRARLDRRHGGDRAAWMSALAPLTRTHARHAATAVGAGSLVAAWTSILKGAAAVALVGGATWWLVDLRSTTEPTPELPAVASAEQGAGLTERASTEEAVPSVVARTPGPTVAPTPPGDPFDDHPWTRLRLRVVDSTGAPVAGARVEANPGLDAILLVDDLLQDISPLRAAREMVGHTAETSGGGIAELRTRLLLATSNVELVVQGPNLGRWSDTIELDPGADVDLGEVVLRPGGVVVCTVLDTSGAPCEARVVVGPAELGADEAAGRARGASESIASEFVKETGEIFVDREGTFRLWSRITPHQPWSWSEPFELAFGRRVALEARVEPAPAPVVIRVLDPEGNLRASAIEVRSDSGGTQSNWGSAGELTLGPIFRPGEPLTVTVHDSAQELASRTLRLEEPRGVVLVQLEPGVNVVRTLRLRSATGAALEDVVVRTHARDTYLTREATGAAYRLDLPDGPDETFDLQVRALEHVILDRKGLVARDLPEDWIEVLAPLPGITGRVTVGGEAVAGAQLHASHRCDPGEWQRRRGGLSAVRWGSGWDGETGPDGSFRIPLQYEGNWVLRVRAAGYGDALVDLSPYDPALGALDLAIELVEPGRVEGLVLDAEGAPAARRHVALSHPLHAPRTTKTDRDGRYELGGIPPGSWTVTAPVRVSTGSGYDILDLDETWTPTSNVQVAAGASSRYDVRQIAITARDGRLELGPLAQADPGLADGWRLRVSADGPDPFDEIPECETPVSGDGAFDLRLPGEGPWILALSGADLAGRVTWKLDALREQPFVLELPLARVAARIGGLQSSARLELRCEGTDTFAYSGEVTVDETGDFGPVFVPAGELEIKLPPGAPLPVPPIEMNAESVSDLVDQAIVGAVLSAAMRDAAATTTLRVRLAPGDDRFLEHP